MFNKQKKTTEVVFIRTFSKVSGRVSNTQTHSDTDTHRCHGLRKIFSKNQRDVVP